MSRKTINKGIDLAIKAAGSQTALARLTGITQSCVSKYRINRHLPNPLYAVKLERELKIPKAFTRPDLFDEAK